MRAHTYIHITQKPTLDIGSRNIYRIIQHAINEAKRTRRNKITFDINHTIYYFDKKSRFCDALRFCQMQIYKNELRH